MGQGNIGVEYQPGGKKPVTLGLTAVFLTYFLFLLMTFGQNIAAPMIAADLNGMALYSWALPVIQSGECKFYLCNEIFLRG